MLSSIADDIEIRTFGDLSRGRNTVTGRVGISLTFFIWGRYVRSVENRKPISKTIYEVNFGGGSSEVGVFAGKA